MCEFIKLSNCPIAFLEKNKFQITLQKNTIQIFNEYYHQVEEITFKTTNYTNSLNDLFTKLDNIRIQILTINNKDPNINTFSTKNLLIIDNSSNLVEYLKQENEKLKKQYKYKNIIFQKNGEYTHDCCVNITKFKEHVTIVYNFGLTKNLILCNFKVFGGKQSIANGLFEEYTYEDIVPTDSSNSSNINPCDLYLMKNDLNTSKFINLEKINTCIYDFGELVGENEPIKTISTLIEGFNYQIFSSFLSS